MTLFQYERLIIDVDGTLQALLTDENYDSISNFLWMSEEYMMSEDPFPCFFPRYSPMLKQSKSTCVGLSYQLILRWHELDARYPGFADSGYVVSCEEGVKEIEQYVLDAPSPASIGEVEKEHVLVCVRVSIDGRPGVILADPGYHLSRSITVMKDHQYPHTGWQVVVTSPDVHMEAHYVFNDNDSNYVKRHEVKSKFGLSIEETSLIYIARPFMSSIDVTERRNLVYQLKSIVARDHEGCVRAGMFFKIRPRNTEFTLLVDCLGVPIKTRHAFDSFLLPRLVSPQVLHEIKICNDQLSLVHNELFHMICRLARILADESYVEEILEMNQYIKTYCRYRPRGYISNDI